MAEKIYAPDGTTELPARRPNCFYGMFTGPDGEPAYREYTPERQAQRETEEADFSAWRALEAAHPGRRFTQEERAAFKAARRAGQAYTPPPPQPSLEERLASVEAALRRPPIPQRPTPPQADER